MVRWLPGCGSCTNEKGVEWGSSWWRGPAWTRNLPSATSVVLDGVSGEGSGDKALGFGV
jgi:hypothetical protein